MESTPQHTPVDRFVNRIGGESLLQVVPFLDDPLVIYAVIVVFYEQIINQTVRFATGYGYFFLDNPLWLLRPIT